MKLMIPLLILWLAAWIFAFLRFLIQRIVLLVRLRRFAQEHTLKFNITDSLFFFLPINSSSKCSFTMETDSTVYKIQLMGLLGKSCEVHFWNAKEYSVTKFFLRWGYISSTPLGQTNAGHRHLGEMDYSASNGREVVPILLLSPANTPVRLTQTEVNHMEHLRVGDKIQDVIFADWDYLFGFIVKYSGLKKE